MDRKELKAQAKSLIKGKILKLLVLVLAYAIAVGVFEFIVELFAKIPFIGWIFQLAGMIVVLIASYVYSLGTFRIYFDIAAGKDFTIKEGFMKIINSYDGWFTLFKSAFLSEIAIYGWSLLLVVPGVIKACAYAQSVFIAAENVGIKPEEALLKSTNMMEGHKKEYFILILSFIGWILLGVVTFGLGLIYVIPYLTTTQVLYYNKVK